MHHQFCKFPHLQRAQKAVSNGYDDDPVETWEKGKWSDETKIQLFGKNSTRCVWRKKNDECRPKEHDSNCEA